MEDGYGGGIGAGSSRSKARSKELQEQKRQQQGKTEKAKNRKQDEKMGANTTRLEFDIYGMVCKIIKQRRAYNKGKPPSQTYEFSHEELVKAIKLDSSVFEVGNINTAVKRIEKTRLVKINSNGSWDEDGYRARWKFEVKPNVNSQILREQVLLQPIGLIMDVDKEFLDGTGKEFYKVRAIGERAERHALIIIGYGETKDRQFFFICQNSWGKNWGYNGIGRLIIDDTCPISIFYPKGGQLLG